LYSMLMKLLLLSYSMMGHELSCSGSNYVKGSPLGLHATALLWFYSMETIRRTAVFKEIISIMPSCPHHQPHCLLLLHYKNVQHSCHKVCQNGKHYLGVCVPIACGIYSEIDYTCTRFTLYFVRGGLVDKAT
jgi:hypothetical protein